jgi:hypothetical protein
MGGTMSRSLRELIQKLETESKLHPGGFAYQDLENTIEDGDYGDPEWDERPEFVQQDDAGWIRLKPVTRRA